MPGISGYGWGTWHSYAEASDLLVPTIFFFGALFVLIVNILSLQSSLTLKRIYVLENENITDPLMGIYNRRYLDRRLAQEVSRSLRYDIHLSVLLIDIDHFKAVNDIYGHQAGDSVLAGLGELALNASRKTDIVARYGGEELVIITPNTSLTNATILAERFRKVVENSVMVAPDEQKNRKAITITVSIGVACLSAADGESGRLIEKADKALYRAKQMGRNQVVVDDRSKTA